MSAIDPIINIDASKSTDPDIERLLPEDRLDIEGTLCYNAMILNYTWTCNVYNNGFVETILTSNCQAAINRASEGTYSNETSCQDPMGNQAMRLCCHQSILQVGDLLTTCLAYSMLHSFETHQLIHSRAESSTRLVL